MADVFAWTGIASAFRAAGFGEVARPSPTRPIVRAATGVTRPPHALTVGLHAAPRRLAILPRMHRAPLAAVVLLASITAQNQGRVAAGVPWLAFARSTFA